MCNFAAKKTRVMQSLRKLTSFLFFITLSIAALAQKHKGEIKGTIRLTNGQPAAYVTVEIAQASRSAVSDENGEFLIRNLAAGTYHLQVSLVGYETVAQDVTVTDGTATISLSLALSQKQLEEVVVRSGRTGYKAGTLSPTLRLNEPLLQVPQNIQVITNKALADQQITSMSDGVIRNVSGATRLEHWGDLYTRINMRGARASAFRNGMNITSTWGPLTEDMSFVDHIEFVKGPAGFMMSNGEPSGIYNVVTKRPTGETKGEASLLLGSYDLYRSTLDLDGRLDKEGRLLYRFNVMGQTKNSFRPYEYNDRYSIAPVISYKISDNTVLTAEYVFQHAKMSNIGSYYVFSVNGYANLPRNFTTTDPGLDPTVINDQSLTLNLKHEFNKDWKLTAQAAYFNYRQEGSSAWPSYLDAAGNMIRNVSIWDASNISKFGQVYVNGHVQTGAVQHRILAGLDMGDKEYLADWNQGYDLDSVNAYFNVNRPTYGVPVRGYPVFDRSKSLRQRAGIYGQLSEQYTGVYIQDELGFFDNRLRLTLAGRYTYVKDNAYGTETTDRKATPRAGLSYSVNKYTSVYALYDQSFLPQSGIQRNGDRVKPVTGNNLEAGIKKDWFGGSWNTSLSVYRIMKNNELSSDPQNSASEFFVLQLGQSKTEGVEFDVRGTITNGLSVIANYAFTSSKITKATTELAKGAKVPGYSEHTANAWLVYRLQKGALQGLGINAGITYEGKRSTWDWGAAGQAQLPDYFRADGGLSWERGKITLTANVFNLLDKYLYSGAYYGYGGYYYWQAEAGRNARLGINFRF